MIVDTHVHLFPPEIIEDREKIAEREPHFGEFVRAGGRAWGSAGSLLDAMDEDGVVESWICGFGFDDLGLCKVCNDYAESVASGSNGRLKWLCAVPPMERGATEEIERCASLGAIGVGEVFPDSQGWAMDETRETWRMAGACHENDMYILVHVDGHAAPSAYSFARNHPESVIVMAHWGAGLLWREGMKNAKEDLLNVYYDTASAPLTYEASVFEAAFRLAPQKILYGSNFPLLTLQDYKELINDTDMSGDDVDRMFFRNARDLLELSSVGPMI